MSPTIILIRYLRYIVILTVFFVITGAGVYLFLKIKALLSKGKKEKKTEIKDKPNSLPDRWKKLSHTFEREGLDLKLRYKSHDDLFLHLLRRVKDGESADRTYLMRVYNLYEHLERELHRELNAESLLAVQGTLNKISDNLTEHYEGELANNQLQLSSSLKAIEQLLSQMNH